MNLPPPPAQKYEMLNHRRALPTYIPRADPSNHRRGCCRRCLCCFCTFLLLLLLAFVAAFLYVYLVVDPKFPAYKIDSLTISTFDVKPLDMSLGTEFTVAVRAENPNEKIGIRYGDGGEVSVGFNGTTLCRGRIPGFYQPERNTMVLAVRLSGKSSLRAGAAAALAESRSAGKVPLDVRIKVPVGLRLGG
ncbi:NDR1/HIN1-like protein 6 [Typha angustifolia]|uniref:NDR1/HIN1-like protein 6 n=1 Tax=Typha angustifolia TaxID=59011 RepID=UPI003C2AEDBF